MTQNICIIMHLLYNVDTQFRLKITSFWVRKYWTSVVTYLKRMKKNQNISKTVLKLANNLYYYYIEECEI